MKKISLIIVTYNSFYLIDECLDSIYKFNDIGDNLEVIVVDNASKDQEQLFYKVNNKYGSLVKLIDGKSNGGYGKGNNIGVSNSSGDILIIMNPDIRLTMPTFKRIIDVFSDSTVGMIGVNFIDGSCPFYNKPEYLSIYKELSLKRTIKKGRYDSQTMYMSGSFLGFTRESYLGAGGFDENIFLYFEEPDMTNRIQAIGKKVIWCPEIYVNHLPHTSKFSSFTYNAMLNSLRYYSSTYNIDFKRNLKIRISYLNMKRTVAKLVGNQVKSELFGEIIELYKEKLNKDE